MTYLIFFFLPACVFWLLFGFAVGDVLYYIFSAPTLDNEYSRWWHSQPLWWKIKNSLSWKWQTFMVAIKGGTTPGERLLISVLNERKDK